MLAKSCSLSSVSVSSLSAIKTQKASEPLMNFLRRPERKKKEDNEHNIYNPLTAFPKSIVSLAMLKTPH